MGGPDPDPLACRCSIEVLKGFTDTQERGPMARWIHRHGYRSLTPDTTEVTDQIWYQHPAGWRGLLTRLLFSNRPLLLLFRYRAWATRRALGGSAGDGA